MPEKKKRKKKQMAELLFSSECESTVASAA